MRMPGLEEPDYKGKEERRSEHTFLEAVFTLGDLPIVGTGGEAEKLGRASVLPDRKLAKIFNTSWGWGFLKIKNLAAAKAIKSAGNEIYERREVEESKLDTQWFKPGFLLLLHTIDMSG